MLTDDEARAFRELVERFETTAPEPPAAVPPQTREVARSGPSLPRLMVGVVSGVVGVAWLLGPPWGWILLLMIGILIIALSD